MPRRRWAILAAITLARLGFGFQFQTVASLGPVLVTVLHLDYALLGTLIGLFMLPGAFVALPGGLLARRLGDRVVMGGGLALLVLGALLPGLLPGTAALAVGRVVAGTGAVMVSVLQSKIIADWFTDRAFVTAIGLSVGAFPLGVGLCQVATPLLSGAFGWRADFLAGAALTALALALFLAAFRVAEGAPVPRRFALPSGREILLTVIAGLVWTTYNAGYFGYLSYAPSLMHVRGHGDGLTAATLALATWGNMPAVLLGGVAAGRWGKGKVLTLGMLSLIAGSAGMAVFDWPLAWAALFGTLGAIETGVIIAVATLSARPENRAVAMGMFYTLYYVGGTIMPALCGHAADRFGGPGAALLTGAAVAALAIPFFTLHQRLSVRFSRAEAGTA